MKDCRVLKTVSDEIGGRFYFFRFLAGDEACSERGVVNFAEGFVSAD